MARVELRQVSKVFGQKALVLDALDLQVEDGEILALVGPNGCGKTTLLRLIAGLDQVTGGDVWIGGRCVTHCPARHRNVAMVFQSAVLYPHLTVEQNLHFGLQERVSDAGGGGDKSGSSGTNRAEAQGFGERLDERGRRSPRDRVRYMAQRLGIESLLGCLPRQLSGGQRQRVALGRALVRQPAVFLLDEPALNVDTTLRQELPIICRQTMREVGGTMILVSHDHSDSLAWADRVAVLSHGRIQQVGHAASLSAAPSHRLVAESLGNSPMYFVEGELCDRRGSTSFVCAFGRFVVPPVVLDRLADDPRATVPEAQRETGTAETANVSGTHSEPGKPIESGRRNAWNHTLSGALENECENKRICLGWRWDGATARPVSDPDVDETGVGGGAGFTGTVQWLESRGDETIAFVALEPEPEAADRMAGDRMAGDRLVSDRRSREVRVVSARVGSARVGSARVGSAQRESSPVRSGTAVQVRVDPTRAFWFDGRTGANLQRK